MSAEWPRLTVTLAPETPEEWILALRHAPFGTVVSDRDGDIWVKRGFGELDWLRKGGGWADAEEVAEYAPFHEVPDEFANGVTW